MEGIGDEAYLATPGVHILSDGYYISIALGNLSDKRNQEMLKEAGLLAVDNLKATLKQGWPDVPALIGPKFTLRLQDGR